MNYQNMLCLGDSQTFGARTYGCYPVHLARLLTERTPYQWRTINRSVNGYTARDLWFKIGEEIDGIADAFQACLLIGTNDVGNDTDIDLFAEYYRQILRTLAIKGYRAVFCADLPPIHADGHVFFARDVVPRREAFNERIRDLVAESPIAHLVQVGEMGRHLYVDPVHFSEAGNLHLAECFCAQVVAR